MKLLVLDNLPKLHTTPLSSVRVENSGVIVEVDDEHEQRIQFVMRPYQAVRMTTADCFLLPPGVSIKPQMVCEIADSEWIAELKHSLSVVNETGTFLNKAHHYLFPLQDDFLEVVAWGIDANRNVAVAK
jgi:hypothetical protein